MKKLFFSILLATATSVAFGQGQGELTTTTTTTRRRPHHRRRTTGDATPAMAGRERRRYIPKEGAVQVAIRTGKPLQLINPAGARALRRRERSTRSHEPKDPGKPKGIVFFAWTF